MLKWMHLALCGFLFHVVKVCNVHKMKTVIHLVAEQFSIEMMPRYFILRVYTKKKTTSNNKKGKV